MTVQVIALSEVRRCVEFVYGGRRYLKLPESIFWRAPDNQMNKVNAVPLGEIGLALYIPEDTIVEVQL